MTEAKRVLVTGATGFIGRHLCSELVGRAWPVRGTYRATRPEEGVEPVLVGDIGGATDWSAALEGIEAVIHLAAETPATAKSGETSLAETNVAGTARLARAAAQAGVQRFVFVSSIKVNGEVTHGTPFRASDPPAPRDAYGRSKRQAEEVLRSVSDETGLAVTIVRPPLVYGPGVGANFLRLVSLVERGLPLPLGSVRNARSLVAVRNLADLLRLCAVSPAAAGRTCLVSDGQDLSTPDLIRLIARHLGRPARLFPFPPVILKAVAGVTGQADAVARLTDSLALDIAPTRMELGWKPPVSIDEGLAATVHSYRSRLR